MGYVRSSCALRMVKGALQTVNCAGGAGSMTQDRPLAVFALRAVRSGSWKIGAETALRTGIAIGSHIQRQSVQLACLRK